MQRSISPEDLRILHHEADVAARRLQRQYRLSRDDLDDLRQELLVDLIARLGAFDPQRGSLGIFAGIVMANRATRIAQRVIRHRRIYGAAPVSLNEVLPDSEGATRGELVSQEQNLAAVQGHWINPVTEVERRIDLERGLGALGAQGRRLAANLLSAGTPHQLAKRGKTSRSELYRQTRELRLTLMSVGIKAA